MTSSNRDRESRAEAMTATRPSPYPMPIAAAPPVDGPSGAIQPLRSVLLVQLVRDHLPQPLHDRASVRELLANVARLTHVARSAGVPVVYTLRASKRQEPTWADMPDRSPGRPPAGAGAVPDVLQPQIGDTVFIARRHSAFAGTRLRARLKELGRDQLVVVGTSARTDVLLTAADARIQDLMPFAVTDAVVDATSDDPASAVRWLATTCAVLKATDSVVEAFRTGSAEAM
ncbi:isochorismatase family protein [Streptomyces antibioticus]|uniref:isochorismatase family protein n=1 Tax=Streptomyces antibioticus TaxID=1890 RepID=UPI0036B2E379